VDPRLWREDARDILQGASLDRHLVLVEHLLDALHVVLLTGDFDLFIERMAGGSKLIRDTTSAGVGTPDERDIFSLCCV
jgi:hypothetical protein